MSSHPFSGDLRIRGAALATAVLMYLSSSALSVAQQAPTDNTGNPGELVDINHLANGDTERVFMDSSGAKRHFVRQPDGTLVGSWIEAPTRAFLPETLGSAINGLMGPGFTPGAFQIAPMVAKGKTKRGQWTTVPNDLFSGILGRSGIIPGVTAPAAMRGRTGFLEFIRDSEVLVPPTNGQPGATRSTVGYFVKIGGTRLAPGLFSDDEGTRTPVSQEFFVLMSYDFINTPDGPLTAFEVFVFTGGDFSGSTGTSNLIGGFAVGPNGTLLNEVPLALANQRRNDQPLRAVTPGVASPDSGCLACHSHSLEDTPQATTPFPWQGKFDDPSLAASSTITATSSPVPTGPSPGAAQQSTTQAVPANGTAAGGNAVAVTAANDSATPATSSGPSQTTNVQSNNQPAVAPNSQAPLPANNQPVAATNSQPAAPLNGGPVQASGAPVGPPPSATTPGNVPQNPSQNATLGPDVVPVVGDLGGPGAVSNPGPGQQAAGQTPGNVNAVGRQQAGLPNPPPLFGVGRPEGWNPENTVSPENFVTPPSGGQQTAGLPERLREAAAAAANGTAAGALNGSGVAPPQQSATQAIAAWIAKQGPNAPVPINLIHQQEQERLQAAAAAAANGTANVQNGSGVAPPQQSATQAIAAWIAANGINAPVPINLIHQQERERLQAAAAANGTANAGAPGSSTVNSQQTASAGSGGATQSGPFNLPDDRGYAGGITKHDLAGGGYELVRPVGANEVHDVYGPANQLLTTYTEMPASSVTMSSGTAATSNATAAPATTHDLPGGGLEVIHPSEFVPGVNNHLIYGPKNAAGDRSLVTSFLQPQPLYGTSHLGPAQTMTLDTEKEALSSPASSNAAQPQAAIPYGGAAFGPAHTMSLDTQKGVSSEPTSSHPAETVPANANTLISRAAADKREEMLHELNATTLRSSAAISPGATTPTAIRQNLEQEMKSAIAPTGGNASLHETSGATTPGASRQNLEQEMKSALAPTGGNTTSHETSGVQQSNTLRKFESVVTPHANTPANATANATANTTTNAPTNAISRLHETLPRSTDAAIVHSNAVTNQSAATVVTTHAPVMLAPVRLSPPPPPPKKK